MFSCVEVTVGDRANLMPAIILTVKIQFIEPVIKRTNRLIDDHYDEIDYIKVKIQFVEPVSTGTN